jgi:hypothetical protein
MRKFVITAALLASGAVWADAAVVFGISNVVAVHGDMTVEFSPGVSPDQAAQETSEELHLDCSRPQTTHQSFGRPGRGPSVTIRANGNADFVGFTPSSDAREYFTQLGMLIKCP